MTKKEFKAECSFHEYGRGKKKRNAIYFGWKSDDQGRGFKYMVKTSVENAKKAELFDVLYTWVTEKIVAVPWYVEYKFAPEDKDRFKVSLMG